MQTKAVAKLILILLTCWLTGCASLDQSLRESESPIAQIASSPNTFAVCKAADVLSTAKLLETGKFVEANPVIAATLQHGYFPLIAISFALWYALREIDSPSATLAANVITCGVAAHNISLFP